MSQVEAIGEPAVGGAGPGFDLPGYLEPPRGGLAGAGKIMLTVTAFAQVALSESFLYLFLLLGLRLAHCQLLFVSLMSFEDFQRPFPRTDEPAPAKLLAQALVFRWLALAFQCKVRPLAVQLALAFLVTSDLAPAFVMQASRPLTFSPEPFRKAAVHEIAQPFERDDSCPVLD